MEGDPNPSVSVEPQILWKGMSKSSKLQFSDEIKEDTW
jgi:hypothetical protein